MVDAERLAAARRMVEQVLRGEVSPDTHPALFEEDVVYFNVNTVEQADVSWLMTQLGNAGFGREARLQVARNMSGPKQKEALAQAEQA